MDGDTAAEQSSSPMKPALLPPEASRRTAIAIASGLAIAAILLLERARPLRGRTQPAMRRSVRNVMMGAMCASVVVAVEQPLSRSIAIDNVRRRRGLAQQAPRALRPAIAFLAMDYGFYLWHVATHEVPWLWRLHRVHHVDPDLDMSTAVRFHMVDMLVSLPWRAAQVRISGIDPATLDRWQLFFTLSILFHHANLRLPADWDRRLAWLVTTPAMHGIHHSARRDERDSNWSSGLSLWDRLHRTLRQDVAQDALTIGVDDARALADVPIERTMRAPFDAVG